MERREDWAKEWPPEQLERLRQLPRDPNAPSPEVQMRQAMTAGIAFRLADIFRRHIRVEDKELSDHDLVLAVHNRYLASREDYLIDPSE